MNIFAEAGKLQEQCLTFALASIISVKGSTPRNTAKMIVKEDGGTIGTIGGGLAEAYIIAEALSAIRNNQSKVVEYTLNSDAANGIQMLCGGSITVFIEVILNKPRIVMIGAGHVGLAVSKLVDLLDYRLTIVDERQEYANAERYPKAVEIFCSEDISGAVGNLHIDGNTYVIIATKDSDMDSLKKVLNSGAAYIGMIGSKRKVAVVLENLRNQGFEDARLKEVFAPVGLDIGAETPEEIAVSILAEILKVRNGKTGQSLKELNKHE